MKVVHSKRLLLEKEVVQALNNKNYQGLNSKNNIDVLNYKANFISNEVIELQDNNGTIQETITADKIVINTGSRANIPDIKGIDTAQNIYDSTGLLNIDYQPQELVMVVVISLSNSLQCLQILEHM